MDTFNYLVSTPHTVSCCGVMVMVFTES